MSWTQPLCQPEPAGLFQLSYNTIIAKVVGFWKGRFTSITLGCIIRLLICTLRGGWQKKWLWKLGVCRITFLQPEKKSEFVKPLCSNLKKGGFLFSIDQTFFLGLQPEKKSEFEKPLFSNLKKNPSLQNHFSTTWKFFGFYWPLL